MGEVVGAALFAGVVFLGAAGLKRLGYSTNAAVGLTLLGVVILASGGLLIAIKVGL